MGGLAAPLAGAAHGAQQPVERGLRAEVGALVEQDRPGLGRSVVDEAAEDGHHARAPAAQHHRDDVLGDLDLVTDAIARRQQPLGKPLFDRMPGITSD